MTSKARRVGARKGLSAKKTIEEKSADLADSKSDMKPVGSSGPRPTEGPKPSMKKPPVADCRGWGGVSNAKTNNRGGRRGR